MKVGAAIRCSQMTWLRLLASVSCNEKRGGRGLCVVVCGCVWLCVAVCGCVCGCVWLRVVACGCVWLCVVVSQCSWANSAENAISLVFRRGSIQR